MLKNKEFTIVSDCFHHKRNAEIGVYDQALNTNFRISIEPLKMRAVIQRVSEAKVTINGSTKGQISQGYLILLGIEINDTENDADYLVNKISGLRIFADSEGKMNHSIIDINGAILLISQFTLHASYKKGNRPGFTKAARPEQAIPLYQSFISKLEIKLLKPIACGEFGADMKVSLVNDGPVTIIMDSKNPE